MIFRAGGGRGARAGRERRWKPSSPTSTRRSRASPTTPSTRTSPSGRAHLSVRPVIDGRTARATTNRLDRDGIRDVVEEAIAITRLTEPDADLLPLAEPARVSTASSAGSRATARGRRRRSARRPWRRRSARWKRAGQTAAGIYSTDATRFRAAEFARRGGVAIARPWRAFPSPRWRETARAGPRPAPATTASSIRWNWRARPRARRRHRADPRELPAGRYTVILEPAAVLDLVGPDVRRFQRHGDRATGAAS